MSHGHRKIVEHYRWWHRWQQLRDQAATNLDKFRTVAAHSRAAAAATAEGDHSSSRATIQPSIKHISAPTKHLLYDVAAPLRDVIRCPGASSLGENSRRQNPSRHYSTRSASAPHSPCHCSEFPATASAATTTTATSGSHHLADHALPVLKNVSNEPINRDTDQLNRKRRPTTAGVSCTCFDSGWSCFRWRVKADPHDTAGGSGNILRLFKPIE